MIQAKASEAADFRSSPMCQRIAERVEYFLGRDFCILRCQVMEALGQLGD